MKGTFWAYREELSWQAYEKRPISASVKTSGAQCQAYREKSFSYPGEVFPLDRGLLIGFNGRPFK
jgi:hypothetical protein